MKDRSGAFLAFHGTWPHLCAETPTLSKVKRLTRSLVSRTRPFPLVKRLAALALPKSVLNSPHFKGSAYTGYDSSKPVGSAEKFELNNCMVVLVLAGKRKSLLMQRVINDA